MNLQTTGIRLMPKLWQCLRGYTRQNFISDLMAGITVGLVSLPLAMAFGIASGVTPQAGIYTAVVAGFLISAFGGSRTQVGGPTGAFVVVILGIIRNHGLDGLYMVSIMAGLILILMAVTGLGTAVKFIPRPVTIGFTNGIAVLIASTQIVDFFGLSVESPPGEFLPRMAVIARSFNTLSLATILVAGGSLALIIMAPRISRHLPGTILALLVGTLAVTLLKLPVETIATRFGGVPSGFPAISMPRIDLSMVGVLMPSAVTVAFLAALESLLSAVVADSMSGDRHNSNAELMAQGLANLATPFFGGIPATGAIARTATNIRSGAKTPVAGIIHALTLLLILLVAAPLARFIPLGTLAAVLFVVAYNMGEWREIAPILRQSKADKTVWAATFALTVLVDLTVAVQVGMLLAVMLYIHRIAQTTTVAVITDEEIEASRVNMLQHKNIPPYVSILRIHGPFLFGTTDKLLAAASDPHQFAPIVILRLRNMTALDNTGLHTIEVLGQSLRKAGKQFLICGAQPQPARLIAQSNLPEIFGAKNILPHVDDALARAREIAGDFEGFGHQVAADYTRRPPA